MENFLVSENAVVQVVLENEAIEEHVARDRLSFANWETSIASLVDLFVSFAVLNRCAPSAPTVSLPLTRCITSHKKGALPKLDPLKVAALVDECLITAASLSTQAAVALLC